MKGEFYNEIDKKINNYRVIAKNNPDKFYILLSKPNAYIYLSFASRIVCR